MSHDGWQTELANKGWVCTVAATTSDLLALASQLGAPIEGRLGRGVVDVLKTRPTTDAPKKSLSGIHGMDAFPLHTDFAHRPLPPRWVLLRAPRSNSCATLVSDAARLDLSDTERPAVASAIWIVDSGRRAFLANALSPKGHFIRYDAACMKVAHPRWAAPAQSLATSISRLPIHRIEWTAGRVLILDNARMLHGRDASSGEPRELERVVVSEAA